MITRLVRPSSELLLWMITRLVRPSSELPPWRGFELGWARLNTRAQATKLALGFGGDYDWSMNAQYFCDVFFVNDFLLYIR
jgi:hypothetical protein